MYSALLTLGWTVLAAAHTSPAQKNLEGPHQSLWYNTLPGDGGTQVKFNFISEFAKL
jgi:agmatinase